MSIAWTLSGPSAPVLLQPTVRLVGEPALDQAGVDHGLEVILAEGGAVGKAQLFPEFQRAGGLRSQALQQGLDLVGRAGLAQRLQQGGEEELDEERGVPLLVRRRQRLVALDLPFADHGLHRQVSEQRVPLAQDERLPQSIRLLCY